MSESAGKKLYEAADGGRASEVSSLLRDHPEINVNWRSSSRWTPLLGASFNDRVEVVKLLLAHPDINVNLKNDLERTPFLLGCWNDHVAVVQVLLKDPRVDILQADDKGCTPLWWASCWGNGENINWLIASGRDLGEIINKKGKHWTDGEE